MTKAAHLTPLAWIAAAALAAGCASTPPAGAQSQSPPARQSNVVKPSIEMTTRDVVVARGSRTLLKAQVRGGEAMLFTVDWHIAEGAAGGSVKPARRNDDGSYEAEYTAPQAPGLYQVTATIREFPAAVVTAAIRVGER